ncbi:MAG: molybdopterin-binding protein [Rhizobiales bacterium]|jgi:molybdopterin biosynthesis enzyme|nr:molybdopterin-binding protein [Hyphomicrobiales bacterium]
MVADSEPQRIARLTPLADVLASFDLSIGPVAPRRETLAQAVGLTLAADAVAASGHPQAALALRDGFAVRAEQTLDASAYAPALLSPSPTRVDTGAPLPPGTDAVAPLEAIETRGAQVFVLAAVTTGDGILLPDTDTPTGFKLRLAGARLRHLDVALLTALGIEHVMVRQPRVRVVPTRAEAVIQGAAAFIAQAIQAESGIAVTDNAALEAALSDGSADAVVAIGGTGAGRNDDSVTKLARLGRVQFHGIGVAPGETTALGFVGARPVLLLPGRIDAALAGWLTVGRRLLARLAFRLIEDQPFSAELGRKITSPLGLAEVIPVRRRLGKVEPVASGYLSMQALARAEGWILVPASSEGYPPGAHVVVRPWP